MIRKREKRIFLLVFVTLAVVAALTILSYVSFQRLIQTSRLLSHTSRVINNAEQVVKSVVDIETGQRGYIITGDVTYLKPHKESIDLVFILLGALDSLTIGDISQQQRIETLRNLIEKRILWSMLTIEAANESFEIARNMVVSGTGNETTSNIRDLIKLIQDEERATFQNRSSVSANTLLQFQFFFVGLAVSIMAVIGYLFFIIRASLRERSAFEIKLQQGSEEIQDLYNNAPCGYHSVNADGIIVNINQTELSWLGYSHDEVVGKIKISEVLKPGSLEKFNTYFNKLKATGLIENIEFDIERKDGSILPVVANSKAIYDEHGVFLKSRTTLFDNTIRKKSDELLRESEERHRSVATSLHDAFVIMDEQGDVLNWNNGAEKIFGWTEEEMQGKSLSLIIPEKYRAMHTQGLKRYRETKTSSVIGKSLELEGLRKDNTIFPLDLSIGSWQKGEQVFYCGIMRDITERKNSEKLINEMASIVEFSEDAIISLTPDSHIFSWNKAAEKLYGYTFDEVKGQPISILINEELRLEEEQHIQEVKAGNSITNYETLRTRKDGQVINVSLTISPIKDKSGKFVGVSKIAHDITERKRKELKIQQLNKELDAFTYSVSHDLRAPLRSIAGYSQILMEDHGGKMDSEGKRITNVIIRNAQRMGKLIDDLLNFARLNRKELTVSGTNMKQLVEHVLEEFHETHKNIHVELGNLLPANTDNSMISQVWVNLISNAIKYSGKNKHIKIEIGSYTDKSETCYYVRDNGVGFDMNYSDKLFGVFQRLHKINEFEGTGVGLAIVKRVVQRHRGRVWATGEVNKGATFFFSLPSKFSQNPSV